MQGSESFASVVELFDRPGGWHYVSVPKSLSEPYSNLQDRGLVAVTACARSNGASATWPTSLLPMGDGSHFLALPARVRNRLRLDVGDRVEMTFSIRER